MNFVSATSRRAGLLLSAVLMGFTASVVQAQLGEEVLDPEKQAEIRFIDGLQREGMSDWADKVIIDALRKWPDLKSLLKVRRVRGLIAQGRWDEVKSIIAAEANQDSADVWAMKLAMADGLYAFGRYAEARGIYESFFKRYPKGPTPELNGFFRDSAYKYAQMLLLLEQREEALKAYKRVKQAKLDDAVNRQLTSEMAELVLRMAGDEKDKSKRAAYIAEAKEMVDELMWARDVFFGKGVVMLAHMRMMSGDVAGAQTLIDKYKKQLVELDRNLKEESEREGVDFTRLSPMAQCRYLLAVMLQDEATRLMKVEGYDKAEVAALLSGRPDSNGKRKNGALQHLINVFYGYPQTPWAPDAGDRIDQVIEIINGLGGEVKFEIDPEKRKKVRQMQFANARATFNQGSWKKAAEQYLQVLNRYPHQVESVRALGDLVLCYLEQGAEEKLSAEAVLGHLAERFGSDPDLNSDAGNQMLRLASEFEQRKLTEARNMTYALYFDNYEAHPRAASTLFRFGERRYRQDDLEGALPYFERVAAEHTNAPAFFDAMNRMASIHETRSDPTNELKVLKLYVDRLKGRDNPGHELIAARFRQTQAYKRLGSALAKSAKNDEQMALATRTLWTAASHYQGIADELSEPNHPYGTGAEDVRRNLQLMEASYYGRAYALSRINQKVGESTVEQLKLQAVATYEDLVKRFPDSAGAPAALTQIGTIYSILKRSKDAEKAFGLLREKYPDSQEAKNVLFIWGMNLLELGLNNEAKEKFRMMLSEKGQYAPTQLQAAGQELLKVGEYDVALQAFDKVLASTQALPVVAPAMLGKAEALLAKARSNEANAPLYAQSAKVLDEYLTKFPLSGRTIQANLLAAQAFSETGAREPDENKRIGWFNKAVGAMRKVGSYETSDGGKARADVEVARLLSRKIDAEKAFGSPEKVDKVRGTAIAAYQQFVLIASIGEVDNEEILPHLETAMFEATQLLRDQKLWQHVFDNAELYAKVFPDGRFTPQMMSWRKGAEANGASKQPQD